MRGRGGGPTVGAGHAVWWRGRAEEERGKSEGRARGERARGERARGERGERGRGEIGRGESGRGEGQVRTMPFDEEGEPVAGAYWVQLALGQEHTVLLARSALSLTRSVIAFYII